MYYSIILNQRSLGQSHGPIHQEEAAMQSLARPQRRATLPRAQRRKHPSLDSAGMSRRGVHNTFFVLDAGDKRVQDAPGAGC